MNNDPPNQTAPAYPAPAQPPAGRRWPLGLHHKRVWLVIGAAIIGLALVYYFGLNHKQSASTPPSQAAVNISNAGFMPAEIAVKPGTQVTWTNTDSKAHQVAADPYPKNNSIPGFNSNVLLQTGDSYSFSFSQTGTYHVHDQLNPLKLIETIIVR